MYVMLHIYVIHTNSSLSPIEGLFSLFSRGILVCTRFRASQSASIDDVSSCLLVSPSALHTTIMRTVARYMFGTRQLHKKKNNNKNHASMICSEFHLRINVHKGNWNRFDLSLKVYPLARRLYAFIISG